MSHSAADRNLLFGILALQMDFIDRDQLVAAMNAWVLDKTKALGEILVAQGALAPKRLMLLDTLVEEHLSQHGHDAGKSLAAVGAAGSARAALSRVTDPGSRATLSQVLGDTPSAECTSAYKPTATPCERYLLLRLHAQGGLGEVFVARDEELHREVALKQILDRHAHDPVSRARFVLEAEVTGNLEHPGIVPVYGYGQHEDGRPYYAMRLIKGESLKDAIQRFHQTRHAGAGQRSLELRKLLNSFVGVCQAIHYAHSRGVLHRDLKPANIMLGKFGETLVVDWGLAKPLDRPGADEERSLADQPLRPASGSDEGQTKAGSAVGTPAYMSPEQAGGQLQQLTTASDVYSLGATLYCLLTGQPPFQGETAEVLQKVRKGDFPSPRTVNAQVPASLEAICVKAMALTPGARYSTIRDLADDLEHWLADEPVAAYREPAVTRLARWSRQHRPLVAGVAALLLTTVVALGVGLVLLSQAGARTEQQRQRAEENFAEAQKQRDLARRAVDDYFVQVSENTLLRSPLPGLQPLRLKLLESALKYYKEFVSQAGDDANLQAELAQAYFRVGSITEDIGTKADALVAYYRARDLYRTLAKSHSRNASFLNELAKTCRAIGRTEFLNGRTSEGIGSFQEAISLGEELVEGNLDVPEFQRDLALGYNNLGVAQFRTGQPAAAKRALEQAIVTWKKLIRKNPTAEYRSGMGLTSSNFGGNLLAMGLMPQALEAIQQGVTLNEEVLGENKANPVFRKRLALSLDNLGLHHYRTYQPAKARDAFQQALLIAEPLARENPAVLDYQERVGIYQTNLGHALLELRRDDDARRAFETALNLGKQLPPDTPKARHSYASIHRGLGKVLRKERQADAALKALQQAIEIGEANPDGDKPYSTYELACARSLCSTMVGEGKAKLTPAEQAAKSRYADQAMEALRQAVKEGWGNAAWMRKDPDLDALRDRADFKKLLADLEAKQER